MIWDSQFASEFQSRHPLYLLFTFLYQNKSRIQERFVESFLNFISYTYDEFYINFIFRSKMLNKSCSRWQIWNSPEYFIYIMLQEKPDFF